jgi:hypothetical protein
MASHATMRASAGVKEQFSFLYINTQLLALQNFPEKDPTYIYGLQYTLRLVRLLAHFNGLFVSQRVMHNHWALDGFTVCRLADRF